MTGISPIEAGVVGRVGRVSDGARRAATEAGAESPRRAGDRVEVSPMARYLAKLNDIPSVREDLVARVRAEIESGTYDTPEKLEAAIDALVREGDAV